MDERRGLSMKSLEVLTVKESHRLYCPWDIEISRIPPVFTEMC